MTAVKSNNIYEIGKLKDPKRELPSVSMKEIQAATKRIAELERKR